jgi:hypothetical protein
MPPRSGLFGLPPIYETETSAPDWQYRLFTTAGPPPLLFLSEPDQKRKVAARLG